MPPKTSRRATIAHNAQTKLRGAFFSISREEFYALQSERFVEENFSGDLPSFLAAFTRRRSLTTAEIKEIRKMIDSYGEV